MTEFVLSAVLWDVDGTLVDSEPLHDRALGAALAELGVEPPPGLHERLLGVAGDFVLEQIRELYGKPLSRQRWIEVIDRAYAGYADRLAPRPGVAAIVERLAGEGVLQAACSNAGRPTVELNLARAGFDRRMAAVVSRWDVPRGKPEPDPYLEGARRLGVDPTQCAAIEDSPTGAASALAAGCRTYFWPQNPALEAPPGAIRIATASDLDASLR